MKILLELTDRHLDLMKGELRIPEAHYEYLMRAFNSDEKQEIPEEYAQSVRILRVRQIGLGLGNEKIDCVIQKTIPKVEELEVVEALPV